MKSILETIGEYIFGVMFFMGAFVTIVGTGVFNVETASRSVRLFYWTGVTAFGVCILIIIVKFVVGDRDDSE